jgi:hypothetical protein
VPPSNDLLVNRKGTPSFLAHRRLAFAAEFPHITTLALTLAVTLHRGRAHDPLVADESEDPPGLTEIYAVSSTKTVLEDFESISRPRVGSGAYLEGQLSPGSLHELLHHG